PQGRNARAASTCPWLGHPSPHLIASSTVAVSLESTPVSCGPIGSCILGRRAPQARVPLLRRRKRKSALPGEPRTHGAWRRAGLAVTIIEGVLVDEAEDVSPFLVRSHHELTVRRESAPELLVLIAGGV